MFIRFFSLFFLFHGKKRVITNESALFVIPPPPPRIIITTKAVQEREMPSFFQYVIDGYQDTPYFRASDDEPLFQDDSETVVAV